MRIDRLRAIVCLAAIVVPAGCADDEVRAPIPEMEPSDQEPSNDPAALTAALRDRGVHVGELTVQHVSPDKTIWRFDVDASEAIATWERVRALTNDLGYYPVVCRDEHGTLAELPELNLDRPADTIRAAEGVRPDEWFAARAESDEEYYGAVTEGEWEDTEPQSGWTVPFDVLTGKPLDGVFIALVPTTRPWEVLAHLRYGDWNECPPTVAHVAIHRDWHARFGAEVVCVSGAVVEMRVSRPPTDRAAAHALAREQFLYTGGDLVYQGYADLRPLASALIGARYWYFWWD